MYKYVRNNIPHVVAGATVTTATLLTAKKALTTCIKMCNDMDAKEKTIDSVPVEPKYGCYIQRECNATTKQRPPHHDQSPICTIFHAGRTFSRYSNVANKGTRGIDRLSITDELTAKFQTTNYGKVFYLLSFPTFIGLNTTEMKNGVWITRKRKEWVDRLRIG